MYDLHTHSCISDGTEPVAELVAQVAAAGLSGFALTDHDTSAGWGQAQQAAQRLGLDFLPGMEISCASQGVSIHLLAYLLDPEHEALAAEVSRARESRVGRAQKMVELLAEDYPISWELVQQQAHEGATLGRPHIADALVALKVVESRSEAFARILTTSSKYYLPYYALDPVRAVELVRQAGGVPVMAHPKAYSRGKVASDQVIYSMIEAGLAGFEVYHRDNTAEGQKWLLETAASYDLLVTGASDYHGAGKPNRLGENWTSLETAERIKEAGRQQAGRQ